jgi:hypothetical protein
MASEQEEWAFGQSRPGVGKVVTERCVLVPLQGREWRFAWRRLIERTGDADCEALDEESGEVWQYMGTELHGDRWLHTFRHRHHPVRKERCYVRVGADPNWAKAASKLLESAIAARKRAHKPTRH